MEGYNKPKIEQEKSQELEVETLPVIDGGYYDTLVAVGYGAIADSYYKTDGSPTVKWTPSGFEVHFSKERRDSPDLSWLKYSLAASWKNSLDEGETKIASGWDDRKTIAHNNIVVDTSEKPKVQVDIDGKKREMTAPDRTLYVVINKLGKPDWVNLCINACKERGLELLDGEFKEGKVTLNSIVFPPSSKGANSKNSFSIGNSSMPKSFSRPLSRLTCLAVAGLCYAGIGENPTGFAIPIPKDINVNALRSLAIANRKRYYYGGFFFPYNNYLRMVKLCLDNPADMQINIDDLSRLQGVSGINFVELGNSASPAGTWKLTVPFHKCDVESVDKLQQILINWRRQKTPSSGGDPSIDRKAVRRLMNGFESSNPEAAADGYLQYLQAVGLQDNYNLLTQTFFEEIMANSNKYGELLEEFKTEEIQRFIKLLRQDTIEKVYGGDPPNYQIIRKLREIQSADDFVEAVTAIAVERGANKLASHQSNEDAMQFLSLPYEKSLDKLILLAEDKRYTPRLIAQLLLAFAMSTKKSQPESSN